MTDTGLFTVTEAAKYVGVSAVWLRILTDQGKIACTRVAHGRNPWRYYAKADLDALKATRDLAAEERRRA